MYGRSFVFLLAHPFAWASHSKATSVGYLIVKMDLANEDTRLGQVVA